MFQFALSLRGAIKSFTMKLLVISLIAVLCVFVVEPSEKARFDNYRVYEISIENEDQLDLMQQIENYPDGVS